MLIKSREVSVNVEGDTPQECIRNFFRLVKLFWKEWRSKLGQLGIVYLPNGQSIPFRIVPSLYNLGLINEQVAVANLVRTIFGVDVPISSAIMEAKSLLEQLAEEDRWMTDWNVKRK